MEFRLAKLNIRIDDALHERLSRRAHGAGISISELVRPALEQAADPERGYIYTSQDEILATTLQILAILAAGVRRRSPEALAEGMADARTILQKNTDYLKRWSSTKVVVEGHYAGIFTGY